MSFLYHITTDSEFNHAKPVGKYYPQTFAEEGFIHCSYEHQVVKVANARFAGKKGLVLLKIEPTELLAEVVDEDLYNAQEEFPHIYGSLEILAVKEVFDFPCDADGKFTLPFSSNL